MERTIFWKKQLIEKATELIEKEGIKNVIVSVAPFRLATYAAILKQKFPEINLIIDYRDPWAENKSFLGFKNLSPKRFAHEKKMENKVLKAADYIITVSEEMSNNLRKRSPKPEGVITVLNGYDPDDILQQSQVKNDGKLRFVYGGSLYNNLDYIIEPLLSYLENLKKVNEQLYNSLSFEFYGEQNPDIASKIRAVNSSVISLHGALPMRDLQQKLIDSTFCVLMGAPDYTFAFNTKFFEYLANRKPILLFSNPGLTSDFITKNKLGFHINPAELENNFNTFIANMNSVIKEYNKSFNIEQFSIPVLTAEIEKLLK